MSNYGLDLVYRPDLPALIARWQREVTPYELQTGYQAVLAAADAAGCSRWLLDLRRREDVTEPAVNTWFGTTFAPELRERYGAPVRLAFLVSPLRAQQAVTAVVSAADADCRIATFTDEAAAHFWLAQAAE
ncbi:hypothetical protein [Hymenobacter coccineus]|uniref:STAS/SEC14 domain-containing protein n=1 Tax=Hymenobacter coccineus TaxID=1908235 RepID=A0A1G1TJV0_9BACT|nr:hypothetical protein [Hymenobacter coccineus]OGX91143.1 hypothetical protein BEN49_20900 [Hymenobacter coccineus]